MRKPIFTFLLTCCSLLGVAQNLVPNPDFESFVQCPTMPMYCPFVNNGLQPTATSWFSAISTTTDYYNSCAANLQYEVPNNIFYGFIPPHSGNGCAGIVAYAEFNGGTPQNSYREYLECKLTQPLSAGTTYKLSVWVRSLYRQILQPGVNFQAVAKLEANLSPTALTSIVSPLSAPAIALQKPAGGFITDTAWVQLTTTYTAAGGEEYLTIGTFNDPNNTRPATTHLFPSPANSTADFTCYYLVDDVRLAELGACDTTIAVHHSTLCSQGELELTSAFTGNTYVWNTGATSPQHTITTSGTYWRIAETGCNANIDTFYVRDYEDTLTVSRQIDDLCSGKEAAALESAAGNADSYTWSTKEKTASIQVTAGGQYVCIAEKDCILYIDTFYVTEPEVRSGKTEQEVCFPYELKSVVKNADNITWNDGQKGTTITIYKPGVYSYKAYKECTLYLDTFLVSNRAKVEYIDLGFDVTDCEDAETSIGKIFPGAIGYRWNTGDTGYRIYPKETGYYIVTVNNGCHEISDSVKVEKVRCNDCILLPNAFTPNNDGRNDQLGAIIHCPLAFFQLSIYNRFGQTVYTSTSPLDKWDGRYKGVTVDLGVYYYMLRYTTTGDSKQHILKGDITLIY